MAATSGRAYRGADSKVWQHLEVDCQFKLGANALEAGLQVYPCRRPHFKLRSLICWSLHLIPRRHLYSDDSALLMSARPRLLSSYGQATSPPHINISIGLMSRKKENRVFFPVFFCPGRNGSYGANAGQRSDRSLRQTNRGLAVHLQHPCGVPCCFKEECMRQSSLNLFVWVRLRAFAPEHQSA